MNRLETLACSMALTWHEMNRMNDVLADGTTSDEQRISTEKKIENLCVTMDEHTQDVHAEIAFIANQTN